MEKTKFENIQSEIQVSLGKAKSCVLIAMAWFTNQSLLDSLLSLLDKGISVKMIILDDQINRNDAFGLDFSLFIDKGGILYLSEPIDRLMHNKFCIIDNKIVITGSYNWTNYAEKRNYENILMTDSADIVESYINCFNYLINNKEKINAYSRTSAATISRENFVGDYTEYEMERHYAKTKEFSRLNEPIVNEAKNRQDPKAKYYIGFHAYVDGNNEGMRILVEKGDELPISIIKPSWLNKDDIDNMPCEIYYGENSKSIVGNTKLITLNLSIPKKKKKELHFKIRLTIDTNAYLHIEFVCIETGKSTETTICKPELVNYD